MIDHRMISSVTFACFVLTMSESNPLTSTLTTDIVMQVTRFANLPDKGGVIC
ncbi:hypothetical protein FB471_4010 [Amycolatopsis cihanbeyliensis]|uniref:Uncharacterized protein n=1 Tax=Amycolatopsis cihanbeyliensis TaxID=1128664 RepID=A0A542DMB6_AMYCI|nr:hypothetical protein FB471_4010 [Amycolatopsis cihanbeyliensis]